MNANMLLVITQRQSGYVVTRWENYRLPYSKIRYTWRFDDYAEAIEWASTLSDRVGYEILDKVGDGL